MTNENTESTAEMGAQRSPFSPAKLLALYFDPRRFFSNVNDLDHPSVLLISASIVGIAGAMGRVDRKVIANELGQPGRSAETLMSWLLPSWPHYWLVVIAAGLVGAVFLCYLGGWWYKKRLQWSGATEVSSYLTRRIYVMQELVLAGPTVLSAIIQTFLFANYREAWQAEELWSSSIVVFAFWSCWTSYAAATTAFCVSKTKALIWFLILPVLFYIVMLGVLATLYVLFSGNAV